jgi:hypothetical protein
VQGGKNNAQPPCRTHDTIVERQSGAMVSGRTMRLQR